VVEAGVVGVGDDGFGGGDAEECWGIELGLSIGSCDIGAMHGLSAG
jgi:hypothetical protein